MTRRYLAFDIETATDVPGPGFNWRPYRPLGAYRPCITLHPLRTLRSFWSLGPHRSLRSLDAWFALGPGRTNRADGQVIGIELMGRSPGIESQ